MLMTTDETAPSDTPSAAEIRFRSDVTVELVKSSASDADVLFAARVSTAGEKSLEEVGTDAGRCAGLINYPDAGPARLALRAQPVHLLRRAPIFVFREFMRHRTFSYNEESGRYRRLEPVFYVPGAERKLVQEGKPGRYVFVDGTPEQHELVEATTRRVCTEAYRGYLEMLEAGVAREVARGVLPVSIYSSMYATCNARALMNCLSLRTARDSTFPSFPQREIEMVAERMESGLRRRMPLTHAAWNRNGRVAPYG